MRRFSGFSGTCNTWMQVVVAKGSGGLFDRTGLFGHKSEKGLRCGSRVREVF